MYTIVMLNCANENWHIYRNTKENLFFFQHHAGLLNAYLLFAHKRNATEVTKI